MQHLPNGAARSGGRVARGTWILFMFFALAIAACTRNETGRLAADRTGDVSAPPIAHIAPGDRTAACANLPVVDAAAAGDAIARAPYLQRVTAEGAVVVWTSPIADHAPASVLVE